MHAYKYENYLIWKIGKRKNDELLYINNNELITYFNLNRKGKKNKITWQFGDKDSAENICQDIINVQNKK